MTAKLIELIDKQDNFEIVRDQIAAILVVESAKQVEFAQAAGKEQPELWSLQVYTERATPWAKWQEAPDDEVGGIDVCPVVNVWFESETFDGRRSNTFEQQHADAVYNIDCYGYGIDRLHGDGHEAADEAAAKQVQRAIRLVRNILMSARYQTLGIPSGADMVSRRWIRSVTAFQPEQDNRQILNVQGARIALEVSFNEYAPQVQGQPLELLTVQLKRAEDGQLLARADYDYTE